MSIKQVMAQDHKRCDDAFVQAENYASKKSGLRPPGSSKNSVT